MKLIIAKIWLSLVVAGFLSLFVFMLTQLPLEVWVFFGMSVGLASFFMITFWSIDQLPDISGEDKSDS